VVAALPTTQASAQAAVAWPAPRSVWREVLAADPTHLVSQTPEWLDVVCAVGGYSDASLLFQREDGRRVVLPLVRRALARGALATVESSYGEGWGIGGAVADGGVSSDDVRMVVDGLRRRKALRTLIRPNPLLANEWEGAAGRGTRVVPRLAHVLDLDGGFERVWADRFASGTRTNVRKAERAGVTVERGSSDEHLAAFYGLLQLSFDRWAQKQHEPSWLSRLRAGRRDPLEKFEALAHAMGDQFGVWVASLEGRPVAAAIVLRGVNAHYTRGAMDIELAGPVRANYLLHSAAIRDACEAGCGVYHMGESGKSTSLAFFKTRFGAEAYPYAEYRLERLPFTAVDDAARRAVKRVVRFEEPE
jgi:hypothetical protein